MHPHINILLPDQTLSSLEMRHNFLINKIGYYCKPQNHVMERTDISEAVFMLCLDGCGSVDYKGGKYEIQRGDPVFLEPHTPHRYEANEENPWTIFWVHFSGNGIAGLCTLFQKYNMGHVFRLENYQSAADEFKNIVMLLSENLDAIGIHKACCMLEMLLLGCIETYAHKSSDDNRYVAEAIRFMKENVNNSLDLPGISEHLGISTYHTIRIFKSAVMSTPMQYYNMLRMNEAIRLLLSTELTVVEISQRLHYSSQFYFSQQFKKKMGVSPTSYKKQMSYKY